MGVWLIVCAALIGADQWAKYLATASLAKGKVQVVIPQMLELIYTENDGAALGIFGGLRWPLVGLTVVVLTAIMAYWIVRRKNMSRVLTAALTLIVAGAVGNLIDRVANGGMVVDFLHFPFLDFIAQFSCNLADIWLTAGGVLLVVYVLFFEHKKEGDQNAKASADSDDRV